ncbi:HCCA isomerase/glutathione S-transferase kappa [Phialemonium atrogriseum]|uniref:Glutathione S-transferase kappa n=1 Tax=Phialemonium atrogriseum TaxID=1093897 RepID=A0AAJ0CCK4_9PEZI|nr:HCCA isomerase/glutathione S-transferase kappa [Phialemonium atrogriseum]KAK1772998.1 HCCA isomerase/glutathione S-transferase kappa [Phialemonium atrogriseum]
MARPRITLYLDTVSPFAYEAFYVLRHDPSFKAFEINYVPIFLGGLMKNCGNTPPMNIKNKDKWIAAERLRWAKAFSIPLKEDMPQNFPPLTLNTMRALAAIHTADGKNQGRLVRTLDVLFHKYWVDHTPTHETETLRSILTDILGEREAEEVLADAATVGKKALMENTDRAFDDGAFGLPWMICTNTEGQTEAFWGVDHLGQVLQFLGAEKPRQGGWKAVL